MTWTQVRYGIAALILVCLAGTTVSAAVKEKVKPKNGGDITMTTAIMGEMHPHQPAVLAIALTDAAGKPVTAKGLKEVHTQKFHLLLVDTALGDFHHVHPAPVDVPGMYAAAFMPATTNTYLVWADVTPAATGKQHYIRNTLAGTTSAPVDKILSQQAVAGGYRFILSLDAPKLKVGQAVMATIRVSTPDDQPVTILQPILGAFAHVVGFGEDLQSIAHAHPMGEEPKTADDRAGPEVMFHLEPKTKGFLKLFAQFRINDRDVVVPFGVTVE